MEMYDKFAKYIDLTYSRKDYSKEVNFISQMLSKRGIRKGLIYDVACGSGNHGKLLMKKGYDVVGVDMNKGMLQLARKNVPGMKLVRQDMRKLNMKKKADCIITLFNAINHLSSYADFERMLRSYKRNLKPGGLVIFDTMFDQRNWLEGGYHSARAVKKGNTIVGKVDRSMRLGKNKGFIQQVFIIFEGKKKEATIFDNKYENFIYEISRIKQIIKKVGFNQKMYYNFSTRAKYKKPCYYVFVLENKA